MEKDHCGEQHRYRDEEGEPTCFMGKNSEGGMAGQRQVEGGRKVRRCMPQLREDGSCEAETAGAKRSNGKGEGKQEVKGKYAKNEPWIQWWLQPLQHRLQGRQARERVRFAGICTSAAAQMKETDTGRRAGMDMLVMQSTLQSRSVTPSSRIRKVTKRTWSQLA